ncbi:MAG: hypothetical protein HC933_10345 [Pleurocapsa sp. SU_196_0]|nr:hypothetical protein [Pleurocapsa sp. SU_196_0]
MNLTKLISAALVFTATLTNATLTGPQKLERLTDNCAEVIEIADDAVTLLPGVIGTVAKLAVDNPPVDNWQRELIAKPVAEATYQVWLVVNGAVENLSEFAKRLAKPALELINTLASDDTLTNDERRERLHALVREIMLGLLGVTDLLPAGFRNLLELLKGLPFVTDAIDTGAGFIAEILYQIWKALHIDRVTPTVITVA